MKPQIIDLAATPERKAKSIELVGCFQDFIYETSHKFQFETPKTEFPYLSHLNTAKIIKRLAILGRDSYPILAGMSIIDVDGIIFLGRWNDGVVA